MPKPATILVIEDDDMFRKMVRAMLVSAGYEVLEADSAETGLTLYQHQRANLVILDILMPGMDGLEAIRSLMARDPTVKIIAVSGSDPQWVEEYLKDASTFGAKRVLRKPVTLKQLLAAVGEVLAM